jgi:predicted DCC family thiol-disulfide oxidoreductase YuxK
MSSTLREVSHIAKFDGTNFPLWKLGLWVLLEQHNLIEIVTGTSKIPDEVKHHRQQSLFCSLANTLLITCCNSQQIRDRHTNAVTNGLSIADWKSKDCQARHFILSTVDVTQQRLLLSSTNAHQMWEALSAQHMEHAEDNQHDLMSRFYEYQYKPGHGIKEHIAEIKNLAHLLDDAGTPLSESQVVSKIVCTLPQGYGPFMSSWRRVP